MSYSNTIRVAFEPLRSVAAASLTTNYITIGPIYTNPARSICISNDTDANIIVSFDGTTNNVFVGSKGFKLFDFSSNKEEPAGKLIQARGTQVYVKRESAAATTGNVYVEVYYGYTSS